jgi:hypothetical protein
MAKWLGMLEPNCNQFCVWCDINRRKASGIDIGEKGNDRSFENWCSGGGIKVCCCCSPSNHKTTPMTTKIPLKNYIMDSLHMFCALFERALLCVEWIGKANGTITQINEWFEKNRILCTLGEEELQVKVIGKEIRRFLKNRKSLFEIIDVNPDNDLTLSKYISTTTEIFEVT